MCTTQAPAKDIYYKKLPDGTYIFTDTPYQGGKWLKWKRKEKKKHYSKQFILQLICRVAHMTDLDPALLRSIVEVESAYNVYAVSPAGALGLMQIMPEKALELGLVDPFDPFENLYHGARYFKFLLKKYGIIELALAAYHAGEGALSVHRGVPPYKETKAYIRKILKTYKKYRIMKNKSPKELCRG